MCSVTKHFSWLVSTSHSFLGLDFRLQPYAVCMFECATVLIRALVWVCVYVWVRLCVKCACGSGWVCFCFEFPRFPATIFRMASLLSDAIPLKVLFTIYCLPLYTHTTPTKHKQLEHRYRCQYKNIVITWTVVKPHTTNIHISIRSFWNHEHNHIFTGHFLPFYFMCFVGWNLVNTVWYESELY